MDRGATIDVPGRVRYPEIRARKRERRGRSRGQLWKGFGMSTTTIERVSEADRRADIVAAAKHAEGALRRIDAASGSGDAPDRGTNRRFDATPARRIDYW
jgi:hypothetical protein